MSANNPKKWLITGTSSGFGRNLTELLLERGDTVVATVRKVDALSDLKAKYRERLHVKVLDVTDSEGLRSVVSESFGELGRIDVVVSNAGYALIGAAEELSDKQIARQVDTNLIGSINLARAVIPLLRAQGGGRIIQISSSLGQAAYPTMSVYAATKWRIEGFFEGVIPEGCEIRYRGDTRRTGCIEDEFRRGKRGRGETTRRVRRDCSWRIPTPDGYRR